MPTTMYNLCLLLSISTFLACFKRSCTSRHIHWQGCRDSAEAKACWSATEKQDISQNVHLHLTAFSTLPAGHSHFRHTDSHMREGTKNTALFDSCNGQDSLALMHTESSRYKTWREFFFISLFCFLSAFPPLFSCPLYTVVRSYSIDIYKGPKQAGGLQSIPLLIDCQQTVTLNCKLCIYINNFVQKKFPHGTSLSAFFINKLQLVK